MNESKQNQVKQELKALADSVAIASTELGKLPSLSLKQQRQTLQRASAGLLDAAGQAKGIADSLRVYADEVGTELTALDGEIEKTERTITQAQTAAERSAANKKLGELQARRTQLAK